MKVDLQGLIDEFGIDKLSEETQKVVLGRIMEAIHIRVGLRMGEVLSDEDAKRIGELEKLEGEEALKEIEKIYPDFRKVYQEEVDRIREEMRALKPTPEQLRSFEES